MIKYLLFIIVALTLGCKKDNAIPDPIVDETFDVFHVRFGMTKAQVRANEERRLGTERNSLIGWREANADEAWIFKGTFIKDNQTMMHYQFKDGKLIAASEVVVKPTKGPDFGIASDLISSLIEIAKELGFNGNYSLTYLGYFGDTILGDSRLSKRISWTNENLEMSLGVETFSIKSKELLLTHALTFKPR